MAGDDKVSPAQVEKYLKGVEYPATKDELIEQAEDNDAPDEVLDLLEDLPEESYNSPVDVTKALGELE